MQLRSRFSMLFTMIGLVMAPGFHAAPHAAEPKPYQPGAQARVSAVRGAEEPKNLLKNPSAEIAKNARVDSWAPIAVPPGGKVRLSRVTNQAHSGKASLLGEVAGGDGFVQWVQQVDEFPRPVEVRLSGFIKTKGEVKAHIQIQAFDGAGQQLTIAVAEPTIDGARDWTEVRSDATAISRDAKSIVVRLVLAGKGQAWFDDLALAAVGTAAERP
jgi:hypothetical protein